MSATKTSKSKGPKPPKTAHANIKKQTTPGAERAPVAGVESAKPKRKKPTGDKPKKLSALGAAARVLADAKEPMTTRQLIEVMAAKDFWKSPGGATPQATLYSAILREITLKEKTARFTKTEPGKFAAKS